MQHNIGDELTFNYSSGKTNRVRILKRSVDYAGGYIHEDNYRGNFDYFAKIIDNPKGGFIFCNEKELTTE